jgi:tripartite-type tricarboxylate transporter receptor subunit TctC
LIFFVLALPSWAADQHYPERSIRAIIPWAAGGITDFGSREIADKMSEFLGQSVICENKPGAGGILGTSFVSKAKPDGYSFSRCSSPFGTIVKKVDYRMDDFVHDGVGKT